MARFSVVTETAYNGRDGGIIVDCTWFSVSAFESDPVLFFVGQLSNDSQQESS